MRRVLEDRRLLSGEGADRIIEEVRRELEEAIAFAEASPFPDVSELLKDVYTV
jgi:TPP-dependent pyruvate/acetoin dehydrogenase alpha subunit